MPSDDTNEPSTDAIPEPEDVFVAVGNEIRMEIIWVLYDASMYAPYELSFSELRSQMEADIAPSQLTYHLQQLVGHFIKKTDNGYRLRSAGKKLYWALRAGIFRHPQYRLSVDAGFDCHYCGTKVGVRFDEETVKIRCPNCDYIYLSKIVELPLEAFENKSAAFTQFRKLAHYKHLGLALGVCWTCGNALRTEFHEPSEVPLKIAQRRNKVAIKRICDHCGNWNFFTVGSALLVEPELISFCHSHGVKVLSTPYWELDFAAGDQHVTVRSTNPWEVVLQVTYDGDTLELVVDGDLNIIGSDRLGASTDGSTSDRSDSKSGSHSKVERENASTVDLIDNGVCLQTLRHQRWPDGITCPHCDSTDTIKKGTTSKEAQRYQCHRCDSGFNDLTGTIFAEHHLTLPEMFFIIQKMDENKIAQIARQLDRSYQTVLDFVHKVQNSNNIPVLLGENNAEQGKRVRDSTKKNVEP